jgi:hypothetical protein
MSSNLGTEAADKLLREAGYNAVEIRRRYTNSAVAEVGQMDRIAGTDARKQERMAEDRADDARRRTQWALRHKFKGDQRQIGLMPPSKENLSKQEVDWAHYWPVFAGKILLISQGRRAPVASTAPVATPSADLAAPSGGTA